jgi:hypothetical protein
MVVIYIATCYVIDCLVEIFHRMHVWHHQLINFKFTHPEHDRDPAFNFVTQRRSQFYFIFFGALKSIYSIWV